MLTLVGLAVVPAVLADALVELGARGAIAALQDVARVALSVCTFKVVCAA
jgi:hypothetical protein